tara:strand:+ start:47 stop:655 length:609 start_codon:yes stop_codon:yes gene_type:complete
MSSWGHTINQLERTGNNGGIPSVVKFLKTNPTRHQVLAYTKKAVDQVAKDDFAILRRWTSNQRRKFFYEPEYDTLVLLKDYVFQNSARELGITQSYIDKLDGVIDKMAEMGSMNVDVVIREMKPAVKKFYTAHKRATAKPNKKHVKISYNVSRAAKKWKIRLTKDINGKRVKRTETELKKLIANKKKTCEDRHGKWHFYCNK